MYAGPVKQRPKSVWYVALASNWRLVPVLAVISLALAGYAYKRWVYYRPSGRDPMLRRSHEDRPLTLDEVQLAPDFDTPPKSDEEIQKEADDLKQRQDAALAASAAAEAAKPQPYPPDHDGLHTMYFGGFPNGITAFEDVAHGVIVRCFIYATNQTGNGSLQCVSLGQLKD